MKKYLYIICIQEMNKNELKHGFKFDVESLLQDQFYNPNVFFFELEVLFCSFYFVSAKI